MKPPDFPKVIYRIYYTRDNEWRYYAEGCSEKDATESQEWFISKGFREIFVVEYRVETCAPTVQELSYTPIMKRFEKRMGPK